MPFESRVFRLAKDAEHPGENQDACRMDSEAGVAAIADGVATGIFSRRWARLLVDAVVDGPPDPDNAKAMAQWLGGLRREWLSGIDVDGLAWFQKPKMRQGAFSTLLWIQLDRVEGDEEESPPSFKLHARAVGDSCLLHVREGEILRAFPIQHSEELEADPVVVGSLDLGRDHLVEFQSLEATCRAGDLVVLTTDAVAQWALRLLEQGEPPRWDDYWEMSEAAWQEEVSSLREERQMRYDDATLALLRVVEEVAETGSEEQTREPETLAAVESPPQPPLGLGPVLDSGPASVPDAAGPPPLPADDSVELIPHEGSPVEPDWKERFKSLSEEFAQQVNEQVARGLEQLKKAKSSADEAIRKYRDKFRPHDKE